MRLVYMDEAGVGNPKHDPHLIVAGVVVDPNAHWLKIQSRLHALSAELFPERNGDPALWHATDIYRGERFFSKNRSAEWANPVFRIQVLCRLAEILSELELKVIAAFISRDHMRYASSGRLLEVKDHIAISQSTVYGICVVMANKWMKENEPPDELAQIIVERTDTAKEMISLVHDDLRLRRIPEVEALSSEPSLALPVTKVIESVHYADKDGSNALHFADLCAFAIKRTLVKDDWIAPVYEIIKPHIVIGPYHMIPAGEDH